MLLYKLLLSTRTQRGNTYVYVYSVFKKYVYCVYIYIYTPLNLIIIQAVKLRGSDLKLRRSSFHLQFVKCRASVTCQVWSCAIGGELLALSGVVWKWSVLRASSMDGDP